MRITITTLAAPWLAIAALLAVAPLAAAQSLPLSSAPTRPDVAIAYDFVRGNAPPGGSQGIHLNGGSATAAVPLRHSNFAVAADLTVAHTGSIAPGNYSLTLLTYTGGIRYHRKLGASLEPFAQVLAGGLRASGSLVDGPNSTTSNGGLAFAANLGGGLDFHLNQRIALRLLEADYLVTTLGNQVNDHQNSLRLSAGLVFHF